MISQYLIDAGTILQIFGKFLIHCSSDYHTQLVDSTELWMLSLCNFVNIHLGQKVLHAVVYLLICQPLQHPAEDFKAGCFVSIVVDKMLSVLPEPLFRSIACLYRFHCILASYCGGDYRRSNASGI